MWVIILFSGFLCTVKLGTKKMLAHCHSITFVCCLGLSPGPKSHQSSVRLTDVPDLVRVVVVAPIGNSDHSSLSAVTSIAQAVPNLCVSRKVFFNIKLIGIEFMVQYRIYPGVDRILTILLRF